MTFLEARKLVFLNNTDASAWEVYARAAKRVGELTPEYVKHTILRDESGSAMALAAREGIARVVGDLVEYASTSSF